MRKQAAIPESPERVKPETQDTINRVFGTTISQLNNIFEDKNISKRQIMMQGLKIVHKLENYIHSNSRPNLQAHLNQPKVVISNNNGRTLPKKAIRL